MRVRIEDMSVFDGQDQLVYRELRRLFLRAASGQHMIDVDDPEHVLVSDFYSSASATIDQPEWEELLLRTSRNPFVVVSQTQCHAVVATSPPPAVPGNHFNLTITELGDWAEQPLTILLENSRDQVLLKLAATLSDEHSQMCPAMEKKWIVPDGRGGSGEVLNAIRTAVPAARIFAVIDSDRETADGPPAQTAALIEQAGGDRVYMLKRRELENYIPDSIWTALVPKPTMKTKGDRAKERKAAKEVGLYRWLTRQLDVSVDTLRRNHGQEAVDRVAKELAAKADRSIAAPLVYEQLVAWRKLSESERATDDLKVRFGKHVAEASVQRLSQPSFDTNALDSAAQAELRQLAQKIEEWL